MCTIADQNIMAERQKYTKLGEEEKDIANQPKEVESRLFKLYKTFLLGLAMTQIVRKTIPCISGHSFLQKSYILLQGAVNVAIFSTLPDLAKIYGTSPDTLTLAYIPENLGRLLVGLAMGGKTNSCFLKRAVLLIFCFSSGGKFRLTRPFLAFSIMLLCLAITLVMYPLFSYLPFIFILAFLTGPFIQGIAAGTV